MKKIIALICACFMFMSCVFASVPIVNYDEPTGETYDRIYELVKKDGPTLAYDIYRFFEEKQVKPEAKVVDVMKPFANFDGNYLISFVCDGSAVCTNVFVKLGDYAVRFAGNGHAVYSKKDDQLITYKEAYNEGIITDEILEELFSCQSEENKYPGFVVYKQKPGDLRCDGEITASDLSSLKCAMEYYYEDYFTYYLEAGDMNGDGVTDVIDVIILSQLVMKNEK